MSVTKFLGTFLQATLFGGTYDDVAFEVRVLKGEVARLHDRLDKELDRLHARLDEVGAGPGGGGAKGKSRLRIMSSAEAADVAASKKVEAAPAVDQGPVAKPVTPAPASGGLQVASDATFRPEMTILAAWNAHSGAPGVFAEHHLPGCVDCPLSTSETVAEGAALHSLDAAALLADLEKLVTA